MRDICSLSDFDILEAFRKAFEIEVKVDEIIFTRDPIERILLARDEYIDSGTVTKQSTEAVEIIGIKAVEDGPTQSLRCIAHQNVTLVLLS